MASLLFIYLRINKALTLYSAFKPLRLQIVSML